MTVTIGDLTLHVRDTGHGTPVLLLHGWPDTGDLWQHQSRSLVAAGYRTIVPDLRGFGASSKPSDVAAYAAPALVDDVVGILDALGVGRAHIVGHDWGAAIAWMTAAFAPERVTSVTALSVGHPSSFALAGWEQRQRSWYMLLFQFPDVAEQWLSADGFRNLREWSSHPRIEQVVERLSEPGVLTASLGVYRANVPPETLLVPRVLPPITAPAMGVWSSDDFALTEESMTNSAKFVTGPWRYERLEGAGHWLQLDAPAQVGDLLLDFLRSVQPPN
ncbi:alpha/beta hydrolase [Actinoplanes sp. NPDC051861]|uniref:alpha/beta fold hydrolase n=1 Tax=Actinoplanes sp. NPDC051861 TaxID=3155170 RepID=UPI00344A4DA8